MKLISDRDTGRPRGFGFIEMSNSDASRAMQALNGKEFEGRSIKVNEAQERERSGGGGGGRGGRRWRRRSAALLIPSARTQGRPVRA